MGFFNKGIGKILAVAIPTAIATYFGGPQVGASVGQFMDSQTKSKSSGGGGGGGSQQSQSATAATASSATQAIADQAVEEKKKRLALNAQGASGSSTSPLGATGEATVTKRFLLGG